MLQLCSYETNALGFSPFCSLFTEQDFLNYEYYYDLVGASTPDFTMLLRNVHLTRVIFANLYPRQSFYYNNGPGSPVSAAQGKGYLQEIVSRFVHQYPNASSALNLTFDSSNTYFPLNNSIYADATHEVVVLDTLTAFNLTSLFKGPPLSPTGNQKRNSFVASKLVPFATHFTIQVLECPHKTPSKQIRFLM